MIAKSFLHRALLRDYTARFALACDIIHDVVA
jgi:hypothetical protein